MSFTQEAVDCLVGMWNAEAEEIPHPKDAPVDNGSKNVNWIAFKNSIKSGPLYQKTVDDFIKWRLEQPEHTDYLYQDLTNYFIYLHELKKPDGSWLYAPTSLRGWFSTFIRYFQLVHLQDIEALAPIISILLSKWETGYSPNKACTFTKEQLKKFMNEAENTPYNMQVKAYVPLVLSFAARGIEALFMDWSQLEYLPEKRMYYLTYDRVKTRGQNRESDQHSLIVGKSECAALTAYINCFSAKEREGRFFRKLTQQGDKVVSSKQVLGKNTLAEFGKYIAKWLNLPSPEKYTGHWPRRTAITQLAEAGRTVQQIKCLTGHKSDTVVQGYIDNSSRMKTANAKAISLDDDAENVPPPPPAAAVPVPVLAVQQSASSSSPRKRSLGEMLSRSDGPVNITINVTNGGIHGDIKLF